MVGLDVYIGINTPKLSVPENIQVRLNVRHIFIYYGSVLGPILFSLKMSTLIWVIPTILLVIPTLI